MDKDEALWNSIRAETEARSHCTYAIFPREQTCRIIWPTLPFNWCDNCLLSTWNERDNDDSKSKESA